ncbi:PAS and helix-turn-helix domain-containing protein [Neorhodopirellula lusitana]|uniref:PAS and helix-turn-helix domain-containing protein n=1 Tax=Neorhodopirellula lusitana TaxID=445327 RepID=UPI0024B7F5D9|nr:PAS and helix-turn-helix domain-containing protein [Neorhodopirellula lusitana]
MTQISRTTDAKTQQHRIDPPEIDPASLWSAMTQSKGIGVCVTDAEGRLLFVNDTAMVLFSKESNIEYQGKSISDFHSPQYVKERLTMIGRVLDEGRPLAMNHVYHGKRIHSTVWPIRDTKPPFNRVVVVSKTEAGLLFDQSPETVELIETQFIDFGPLDVLTKREVEVAILLGHGMSVPKVAKLLHRSPKTIERHKSSITQKLKLRGQAELIMTISEMGLDLDDLKLQRLPMPRDD